LRPAGESSLPPVLFAVDEPRPHPALERPGSGRDPHAASRLLPLVYEELRKLAAQRMAKEQPG
jgi:hypothetical protein